jgi:hypothetical protein
VGALIEQVNQLAVKVIDFLAPIRDVHKKAVSA